MQEKENEPVTSGVLNRIADARQAYRSGNLEAYEPLKISGVGYDYATRMTSWGPMMKT